MAYTTTGYLNREPHINEVQYTGAYSDWLLFTGREAVPMDILCTDNNGSFCTEYTIQGYMYNINEIFQEVRAQSNIDFWILIFVICIFIRMVLSPFIFSKNER